MELNYLNLVYFQLKLYSRNRHQNLFIQATHAKRIENTMSAMITTRPGKLSQQRFPNKGTTKKKQLNTLHQYKFSSSSTISTNIKSTLMIGYKENVTIHRLCVIKSFASTTMGNGKIS